MRLSLNSIIYYSLLTLPVSFKIEFAEGVYLYPQELIIAIVVVLIIIFDYRQLFVLPKFISPYLYYFASVLLILVCTLISFSNFIDIAGLFKTLKYLLYIIAVLLVSRNNLAGFIASFNKIAFYSILITLVIYAFRWYTFTGTTGEYFYLTTWDVNYVPSGLSNLNFDPRTLSFTRSAGNHGVYGSYLVLIYLLNLHLLLTGNKKEGGRSSILLIILVVISLSLLTSRESLLIFLLVNLCFFSKDLLKLRLKKVYLYFLLALSVFLVVILVNDVNIGLINKIEYTLRSITESGGEQNINLRFNVWILILLSYILFPFHLLIGYGYNDFNFTYFLKETNSYFGMYDNYASVPESLFFIMLAYGGIIALFSILFFFISLLFRLSRLSRYSSLYELFFYFSVGLFITNNTGGSLMSDMLLAQFSLFYIFIHKHYEQQSEAVVHNRQG
ncbi:O-antigen ligase family protein [Pontibacter russatus]|uniref:O-antigen ligase family protein n=1 Tax=Pontibacter russatus TaxID=2694929 RepID=UPI00137A7A0F|nr:hypothetical protein [Pontibacter russatus]